MKLNRKGLNAIITTVLLIVLVLVAVAILWAFLRPSISDVEGKAGTARDCLTIGVTPETCLYQTCGEGVGYVVSANVRRNSGQGDLTDLTFFFENEGGEEKILRTGDAIYSSLPGQSDFGESGFVFPPAYSNPTKFDVGARVGSDNAPCNPLGVETRCEDFQTDIEGDFCTDLNLDGNLNSQDFVLFNNDFVDGNTGADFDNNGVVDTGDFLLFCLKFVDGDVSGC